MTSDLDLIMGGVNAGAQGIGQLASASDKWAAAVLARKLSPVQAAYGKRMEAMGHPVDVEHIAAAGHPTPAQPGSPDFTGPMLPGSQSMDPRQPDFMGPVRPGESEGPSLQPEVLPAQSALAEVQRPTPTRSGGLMDLSPVKGSEVRPYGTDAPANFPGIQTKGDLAALQSTVGAMGSPGYDRFALERLKSQLDQQEERAKEKWRGGNREDQQTFTGEQNAARNKTQVQVGEGRDSALRYGADANAAGRVQAAGVTQAGANARNTENNATRSAIAGNRLEFDYWNARFRDWSRQWAASGGRGDNGVIKSLTKQYADLLNAHKAYQNALLTASTSMMAGTPGADREMEHAHQMLADNAARMTKIQQDLDDALKAAQAQQTLGGTPPPPPARGGTTSTERPKLDAKGLSGMFGKGAK